VFGNESDFDESSDTTNRKRRNAVAEVFRFLCQQEFKVASCSNSASDKEIYTCALQLLLNGDIRKAILHLNRHKKTKLSLLLSQIVNAKVSGSNVEKLTECYFPRKGLLNANPTLQSIIYTVTGYQNQV